MSLLTIISELEEQIDRIEETGQYIDFVDDVLPEALEEIRQTVLRFAGSGCNLEGELSKLLDMADQNLIGYTIDRHDMFN